MRNKVVNRFECPVCHEMVGTRWGKLRIHGHRYGMYAQPDPNGNTYGITQAPCKGSGMSVKDELVVTVSGIEPQLKKRLPEGAVQSVELNRSPEAWQRELEKARGKK